MTTVFADNFNRPAENPITGWPHVYGGWRVSSNQCVYLDSNPGYLLHDGMLSYPTQTITVTVTAGGSGNRYKGVIARSDILANNCYILAAYPSTTVPNGHVILWKRIDGLNTQLQRWEGCPIAGTIFLVSLACSGNQLACSVGGTLLGTVVDNTLPSGDQAGLYSSATNTFLDDYSAEGTIEGSFSVTPSAVMQGSL